MESASADSSLAHPFLRLCGIPTTSPDQVFRAFHSRIFRVKTRDILLQRFKILREGTLSLPEPFHPFSASLRALLDLALVRRINESDFLFLLETYRSLGIARREQEQSSRRDWQET